MNKLQIFEQPTAHISRLIREEYWQGLTRRIDNAGLQSILRDPKNQNGQGFHHLYVPAHDAIASVYFSSFVLAHKSFKTKLVALPDAITPEYVRSLGCENGLLALGLTSDGKGGYSGRPYIAPAGRLNELYGWDSYFIVLGLLSDGRLDLAKSIADNLLYEVMNFGRVLNANRTYCLTRSQPPFLTSIILAVYGAMGKDSHSKEWLRTGIEAAIREYRNHWMNSNHLTSTGLSRYFDAGTGPCPEVEAGYYGDVYAERAGKHGMDARSFEEAYKAGAVDDLDLDFHFVHDRAMRESGHDTSRRLVGKCAELVTVDLNALLYKIECDIASTIQNEFGGTCELPDGSLEKSNTWRALANHRKGLVNKHLWNERRGMYFDYDFVKGKQTGYVSATTLYPMWAGLASREQAEQLARKALPLLEMPGGIAASSEHSRASRPSDEKHHSWDYPNGRAPHQLLAWKGLYNYGYDDVARRLAYRWLYTITLNAVNYGGAIAERFDVVTRSNSVSADDGNNCSAGSTKAREGFGWTNASYQVGLKLLTEERRRDLDALIPPEWIEEF